MLDGLRIKLLFCCKGDHDPGQLTSYTVIFLSAKWNKMCNYGSAIDIKEEINFYDYKCYALLLYHILMPNSFFKITLVSSDYANSCSKQQQMWSAM